jgi:hypothetical protein
MTTERYVYIALPGRTELITDGKFDPAIETIIARMEEQVRATWRKVARSVGVSERDCDKISGAFVYPGFRPSTS